MDDKKIGFFTKKDLAASVEKKVRYIISTSISDFYEKYKDQLDTFAFNNNIDFKTLKIEINAEHDLKSLINEAFLKENKSLIKLLFIDEFLKNPIITIGTAPGERAVDEVKNIRFYPVYDNEHYLISDILTAEDERGKKHRYCIFIKINIKIRGQVFFIEPQIGVKKVVDTWNLESNKGNKCMEDILGDTYSNSINGADKHIKCSLFVKVENRYIRARIKGAAKLEKKNINTVFDDKKIYEYLYEDYGIAFQDIIAFLKDTSTRSDMFLVYNNNMPQDAASEIGSGMHPMDKIDIMNHIYKHIKGLEIIKPIDGLDPKKYVPNDKYKSSSIKDEDKSLALDKTVYKGKHREINILVVHNQDSKLYNMVSSAYDNEKEQIELNRINGEVAVTEVEFQLFHKQKGIVKRKDNYLLTLADGKEININLIDLCSSELLKDSYNLEKTTIRGNIISNFIGDKKIHGAIIDLQQKQGDIDAKKILRKTFNDLGIINQFIDTNQNKKVIKDKVRAAILDLFNDLGFCNAVADLQDKVVYTFSTVDKVPFLARMDCDTIEVLPCISGYGWMQLNEIYKFISSLKSIEIKEKDKKRNYLNGDIIKSITSEIRNDKREKILVLEEDVLENLCEISTTPVNELCENVVSTTLLDSEIISIDKKRNNPGCPTLIFPFGQDTFISIGQKGTNKLYGSASKVMIYKNTKGKEVNGAFSEFKDRKGFLIKIVKTNMDKLKLATLVHYLRLTVTGNTHINKIVLQEHLEGLEKHFK
jgi:hypothetical protein